MGAEFRLEVAFYGNYDFGNEPDSGTAVIKKTALICFSLLASLIAMPGLSNAQFSLAPPEQLAKQDEAPPATTAVPAIPDDLHLLLMIRNVVIALNQANITGNYTVLREMGTANFQMTNSSARLAEIFAALRSRKIDLTPIMVFKPKLTAAPALQDGQVLRLTGYFPTTPEQVQFDLAYQHFGEQWLLAGVAINVAPPSDEASAAPPEQSAQAAAEPGRPGEAKPIRIDLSQPVPPAQAKPAAPKKPAAAKKPKPQAVPSQQTAAAQTPGAAPAAAEPPAAAAAPQAAAPEAKSTESGSSWNPFAR